MGCYSSGMGTFIVFRLLKNRGIPPAEEGVSGKDKSEVRVAVALHIAASTSHVCCVCLAVTHDHMCIVVSWNMDRGEAAEPVESNLAWWGRILQ